MIRLRSAMMLEVSVFVMMTLEMNIRKGRGYQMWSRITTIPRLRGRRVFLDIWVTNLWGREFEFIRDDCGFAVVTSHQALSIFSFYVLSLSRLDCLHFYVLIRRYNSLLVRLFVQRVVKLLHVFFGNTSCLHARDDIAHGATSPTLETVLWDLVEAARVNAALTHDALIEWALVSTGW